MKELADSLLPHSPGGPRCVRRGGAAPQRCPSPHLPPHPTRAPARHGHAQGQAHEHEQEHGHARGHTSPPPHPPPPPHPRGPATAASPPAAGCLPPPPPSWKRAGRDDAAGPGRDGVRASRAEPHAGKREGPCPAAIFPFFFLILWKPAVLLKAPSL